MTAEYRPACVDEEADGDISICNHTSYDHIILTRREARKLVKDISKILAKRRRRTNTGL